MKRQTDNIIIFDMNIYLIYKFSDYENLKTSIEDFVKNNRKDNIFYFVPDKKEEYGKWKKIAKKHIYSADLVIYTRIREKNYSENEMENISFELVTALNSNKKVIVAEISANTQNERKTDCYAPDIIYESDYLDNKQLKPSLGYVDSLDMDTIKKELFDVEKVLFAHKETRSSSTETLLKQYEIMLDTSEKMMDRRQGTNNFYITLCSAIFTVIIGLIATKINTVIWCAASCILSAFLLILCHNWKKTLKAYEKSNQAKYEVLNVIEKSLPASIFLSEWEYGKTIHYSSYSKRETRIPEMFIILFGILIITTIITFMLALCGVVPPYLFPIE